MARRKFAYATVAQPSVSYLDWDRKASRIRTASVKPNLVDQASEIFGEKFNPSDYMLTHSTIVCSVDTYAPPKVSAGKTLENGFWVVRKDPNYFITPETQKYINGNNDAWSRQVLLASYPTFIGAQSYVEHVQVESLSKGRIIDAVARDIGESVYIDILVANSLKHEELIEQIRSGKLNTLSMGCNCTYTICTKCGHCAADDTELCAHVSHEKGNVFYDAMGQKHTVAELCGSPTEPGGGVTFIEASWVAVPAFKGAVLRNILDPKEVSEETRKKAEIVLNSPPKQWVSEGGANKTAAWGDEPDAGMDSGAEEPVKEEKKPSSPMEDVADELSQFVIDKVKRKVKDMMQEPLPATEGTKPNENLSTASRVKASQIYAATIDVLGKSASSDADFLDKVAAFHNKIGLDVPVSFYRAVLKVGSAPDSADPKAIMAYLTKLQDALKVTSLTRDQAEVLLGLGKSLKATIRLNG